MKNVVVAILAMMAAFTLSGCDTIGKGKAPIETNG